MSFMNTLMNKTLVLFNFGTIKRVCTVRNIIMNKIQAFQNEILRAIVNARRYSHNTVIHNYYYISTVKGEIRRFEGKHEARLERHQKFFSFLKINIFSDYCRGPSHSSVKSRALFANDK